MKNKKIESNKYQYLGSIWILGLVLLLASCGGSDNNIKKISSTIPSENPGTFNPSGTPITPSENPPTEGCTQTETVTYNPKSLDFGLNQIGTRECQSVTVTSCLGLEAEIDPSSSKSSVVNPEDTTQSSQEAEFEIGSKTKSGLVEICYNRKGEGSHSGKAIVKLDGSHIIALPLTGRTLPKIFTISKPTNPVMVWASSFGPPQKGGENVPYEEYFNVPVAGSVDVQKYADLLSGSKNEVITTVGNGGITQKIPYDAEGRFSGTIQIPNVGRVYPVSFSIKTNKGTLTTSIDAITPEKPAVVFEIRNNENNIVNVTTSRVDKATITNNNFLTAGIVFQNIDVSAPNEDHPAFVDLKIIKSNPSKTSEDEVAKAKVIVYQANGKWAASSATTNPVSVFYHKGIETEDDSPHKCTQAAFKSNTLCIPFPHSGILGSGPNYIEAKICNDVTTLNGGICTTAKATVIVNNNLPNIVIESPLENCVYPEAGKKAETQCAQKTDGAIILKGYVENYDPGVTIDENGKKTYGCAVSFWVNESDDDSKRLILDEKPVCPKPQRVNNSTVDNTYNSGNTGNIKRGTFEINLSRDFKDKLNRYTNLIQIKAQNTKGHVSFKTVSFQMGMLNQGRYQKRNNQWDAYSGQLGDKDNKGNTKRAPLMLNVTQATLDDQNINEVVEKFLNDPEDGIKFADIVQGGKMPGDEDGDNFEDSDENINFEKNLNLNQAKGETFWNFNDPQDKKKKQWIWQNLHASMPQKVRAITRYRTYMGLKGGVSSGNLENVFFDGQCNENDPTKLESGWNVACDSCKNRITTAIVDYKNMKYIYEGISDVNDLPKRRDWPAAIGENLNYSDVHQGKWKLGNIKLKKDGYIDADICIVGKGDIVDGCDDVADTNVHEPAFWGHMAAIPLIKGGITELENDPLLPLVWNVGKVRISLKDALQIKKVKLESGEFTNKVIIHKNKLTEGIYGSIQLDPYLDCAKYYRQTYGDEFPIPFGCADKGEIYPVLIDRTSLSGEAAWADLGMEGKNPWLLALLRDKLLLTFKNMIHCLVEEQANPLINSDAFPYQPWVVDSDKLDLNIAIQKDDDGEGVVIKQLKDATNPIASVNPNISDADITSTAEGVVVKLPFTLAANNIKKTDDAIWGHLYRDTTDEFEQKYPLNEIKDKPYLSLSLGIEELLHSASTVLLKKGVQPILDLLDVTDFKYPKNYVQPSDWTLGIDKVILGRLEICGDIADKLLSTGLSTKIIFSEIKSFFASEETHWDITLDKSAPVTLNMKPVVDAEAIANGATSSAILELGLSNVQIAVHDLIDNGSGKAQYTIGEEAVVIVRLDAIIKLKLDYYKEQRKIIIKVFPYKEIPAYVSVIKKGSAYDDSKVLKDIKETLLLQAFDRLGSGFIEVSIPNKLTNFDTVGFGVEGSKDVLEAQAANGLVILDKTSLGKNGTCDDVENIPSYDEGNSNGNFQGIITATNILNRLGKKNGISAILDQNANALAGINRFVNKDNIEEIIKVDECDTPEMIKEIAGNDIADSLCDLGIKEISWGEQDPNIILDADNGYIHLSTQIMIEIYDWLREQNEI